MSPQNSLSLLFQPQYIFWHSGWVFGFSHWHIFNLYAIHQKLNFNKTVPHLFTAKYNLLTIDITVTPKQTTAHRQTPKQLLLCSPILQQPHIGTLTALVICIPPKSATTLKGSWSNFFSSNSASNAISVFHRKRKWMFSKNMSSHPHLNHVLQYIISLVPHILWFTSTCTVSKCFHRVSSLLGLF